MALTHTAVNIDSLQLELLKFAGHWRPCEQVERRPDKYAMWHVGGCPACVVAYEAQKVEPPLGEFRGWYETWDPAVLEAIRTGDMSTVREHAKRCNDG